ncbi:MAG: hypothetical protein PHQ36_04215 [Anaerolineales bacterium]|nr:hypothetical protein [Anaerolineales bacterium]
MTLTCAQVETVLVSRCKKRMAFVEFAITTNGNNADLNDPICNALQVIGITPANIASVADSDLETVTDAAKLCDLAEVRLLENILGNSDKVTLQAASGTEHFSNFNDALEKIIARKQKELQSKYGIGLGSLSPGKVSLSFQSKK